MMVLNHGSCDMLSHTEEKRLVDAWHLDGDTGALETFIRAFYPLVYRVALGFSGKYNLHLIDLIQEGYVGVLRAASMFDTGRGLRFATYAKWWIRWMCQDYVMRNWSIVQTGKTSAQKQLFFKLRSVKRQLLGAHNGQLSPQQLQEVAGLFKVSASEVERMEYRLLVGDQSLNQEINENSLDTLQDNLVDEVASAEELLLEEERLVTIRAYLKNAMEMLDQRELHIISVRYLTDESHTLEHLGCHFGITKERVRQIEVRALGKLRSHIAKENSSLSELFHA